MKYVGLFVKKLLRYLLKPLSFVPALLVMYMIFSFSSQDGAQSARLSRQISYKAVAVADSVLEKDWSEEQIERYAERIHYYVRKTAHVTEYFVLAVTVSFPLYVYGIRGMWLVLLAGGFCVSFAGLDEYHQSFVAGRGPSARDVAIDSIGILPGIILVRITGFIGRKTVFRPLALTKNRRKG
ncbi:MAG: VanZ family protein [Lachnospiraceae bacterium]|nr:VanZ family protein [Lachnospiraceae bacterium]